MSEVKKTGNLKDIFDVMDGLHGKNAFPVYIPSLKRNVMFKELTTGQEKSIVKTIVDNPVHNTGFIFAIRDVIRENCMEEIDINQLTIIDKTAICLVMRQKSIGETFEFVFRNTNKKKMINISEYVEKFKDISIIASEIVGTDNTKITCAYPTIGIEFELEKEFHKNVDNIEIKNVEDMRNAIGEVFINEVVRYIRQIEFVMEDKSMVLDMNDFDFKTRIQIIEKMGNVALSKVLDYIRRANAQVNSVLTVEMELTKEEQADSNGMKKVTGILGTGSSFFITS